MSAMETISKTGIGEMVKAYGLLPRHALRRPEEYRNLLVRVGGFSARFVELDRDAQLELLSRALCNIPARIMIVKYTPFCNRRITKKPTGELRLRLA